MSGRVFQVLQQMLKMRKDRSVAKSKMVKAEFDRVRNFNEQIESYATEYESQWISAAQKGDTVLQLQTQASFGQKLRATAASQLPEIHSLQSQSREALEKAQQDAERLKTLENFMANRQRLKQKALDQQDEKAQEDVLQARQRSS
jgi:flagellar biosynthesis chaperone FliJ